MSSEPHRNLLNPEERNAISAASHAMSDVTHGANHLSKNKPLPNHGNTGNTEMVTLAHSAVTTKSGNTNTGESQHAELLERYNAAERKLAHAEKKMDELRREREELQQQLAREANIRHKYEKDNSLLRAQIADMTNAQEPIREERYYVSAFRQIGMDIETWAAKETRTMPSKSLSKNDTHSIVSQLRDCGQYGETAAKWFESKDAKFFKERRNLIAVIRHVVAIVLFDRTFDRFIFGCSRATSKYLDRLEGKICLNANYSFANILRIRQAIGRAATETQANDDMEAARAAAINPLLLVLKLLLPNSANERIQNLAVQTVDKSITLRREMTEEQAIYRFYFCDNDEDFDDKWMEVGTGETPMGKVVMCTFPGIRRFTVENQNRNFIAVVKALTKLDNLSHLNIFGKH